MHEIHAPGSHVGLVGFSGSGKTTFVNLILRFFEAQSGRILIDGQDIAKITQDSLNEQIAMIPQDTSLFHRTLMENIRYGRLEATDEEVIEASKRARCHAFAHRLSTLSAMDRILVLDKGRIIEDGTHACLLKNKGHYARMWHMQAEGFLPEVDKLRINPEHDKAPVA